MKAACQNNAPPPTPSYFYCITTQEPWRQKVSFLVFLNFLFYYFFCKHPRRVYKIHEPEIYTVDDSSATVKKRYTLMYKVSKETP